MATLYLKFGRYLGSANDISAYPKQGTVVLRHKIYPKVQTNSGTVGAIRIYTATVEILTFKYN
jgi:hypothetical protein